MFAPRPPPPRPALRHADSRDHGLKPRRRQPSARLLGSEGRDGLSIVWRWPKPSRGARRLMLLTVLLCGLGYFLRGLSDLRDRYIKRLPVDFAALRAPDSPFWPPAVPVRTRVDNLIDNRYLHLKPLAKGQQGAVAIYFDLERSNTVAIKTYTAAATNPIDPRLAWDLANYTATWPAELEASLLLSAHDAFITLQDYFILLDGPDPDASWSWAKVEPFMARGTLQSLAKERAAKRRVSPAALDAEYRPMLVKLLAALAPLHDADMCHDDIKLDNIFVKEPHVVNAPHEWLIGDLGGVRPQSHPWHDTLSWTRQNQWRDCRLNDVRRVLKTYLTFLRLSQGPETAAFDYQFWRKETVWSRIYWEWAERPVGVQETIAGLPEVEVPAANTGSKDVASCPCEESTREALSQATERELRCTSIPRRLWGKWRWAPTW